MNPRINVPYRRAILVLLALGLAAGAAPVRHAEAQPPAPTPAPAPTPTPPPFAEKPPVADLEKLIRQQDWTAVDVAKAEGAKAIPRIEPFLADNEPNIRVLSVDCLGAIGGERAQALLVLALEDRYEQVRAYALSALHDNPPRGHEKALGLVFDRTTKDPFVRQQVPMILGRLGTPEALGQIIDRANFDRTPEVQDGLISGRAKLGDVKGREQFAILMRDAQGLRTGKFMDFIRYENDQWILPLLNLWIDRREIGQRLSTHVKAVERRTCDLAVDETLRLAAGKKEFTVKPKPAAQYNETEIAEVREFLASLGKSPYLKD